MLARVWDVMKATLAAAALITAALVSADKLDRQKAPPVLGAAFAEPVATGAITPGPHLRPASPRPGRGAAAESDHLTSR